MPLPPGEGRGLRPLLPAGDTTRDLTIKTPRRKRVAIAAACLVCRQKKSKCSGTRPRCSLCIRRSTVCLYSADAEEPQVQSLKRKYQELLNETNLERQHQNLFDYISSMPIREASTLFERIRAGDPVEMILADVTKADLPPRRRPQGAQTDYETFYRLLQTATREDADQMLHLVKSGSDVATALRCIQDANLLLQLAVKPEHRRIYDFLYKKTWPEFLQKLDSAYFQAPLYDPKSTSDASAASAPFDIPYSAASLVEPGFGDLKISAWTTVVADESLLAQLLECYFLHGHPFFNFFHKDLFLADLGTGQTRFCSSLLLNAVLAAAAHYAPTISGRNEPWNTANLCYRFFAEARRLWELEMGETRLTSLQAALVLNTVYMMDGLDQVGQVYLVQAAKMAHNMSLFSPPTTDKRTEMDLARQLTAWGLFSWQATVCCHYYKPPLFENPPAAELPDPRNDPSFYCEVYLKYPLSLKPHALGIPFVFFHTAKFRVILNDLAQARFGSLDKSGLPFHEAVNYYHRLMQWFHDLPTCLAPQNIALPSHLQLHLHFQYIIILLFEPFINSNMRNAYAATKPTHDPITVGDIVQASRVRFEIIARLYYTRHSFSTYAPVMLQFLSVLGFEYAGAIENAQRSAIPTEDARSSLLLALHGLHEQAQGSFLTHTVFRLLYNRLPSEAASIANTHLSLVAAEAESKHMTDYIRAAYPVNMVSINADAEEHRLNYLLQNLQL